MATYKTVIHGSSSDLPGGHRHSPTMSFQFTTPTFTRPASNPKSLTISFPWKFWIASGSKYGYKIRVGVKISGSWYSVKTKDASPASGWSYTGTKTITLSNYTSTSISIQVGAYAVDAKQCYVSNNTSWSNLYGIKTFTFGNVPPPYFTITYDVNGGNPNTAPAPTSKQPGVIANITQDTPEYPTDLICHNNPAVSELEHKTFLSWNTAADGSGTEYGPGDEYSTDANCTLYAQWGSTSFTVDTPPDPQSYRVIFQVNNGTPLANLPTRDIPRESWYNSDPGGLGNRYDYQGSYTFGGDSLDIYPQYGSAYVTQAILDSVQPTRQGYIFMGWYLDAQFTTPITIPQEITHTDTMLYAKWKPIPIYQFDDDNTWKVISPLVYKCVVENETKVWKKIAPVYYFNGTSWVRITDQG